MGHIVLPILVPILVTFVFYRRYGRAAFLRIIPGMVINVYHGLNVIGLRALPYKLPHVIKSYCHHYLFCFVFVPRIRVILLAYNRY